MAHRNGDTRMSTHTHTIAQPIFKPTTASQITPRKAKKKNGATKTHFFPTNASAAGASSILLPAPGRHSMNKKWTAFAIHGRVRLNHFGLWSSVFLLKFGNIEYMMGLRACLCTCVCVHMSTSLCSRASLLKNADANDGLPFLAF